MGLHTSLLDETVAFRCHGLMVSFSLKIYESFRTDNYCLNIPLKDKCERTILLWSCTDKVGAIFWEDS